MLRPPCRRPHKGFALFLVITFLAFAAMVISILGVTICAQANRTQLQSNDAQLRQLLLAGSEFARARLQAATPLDAPIALPDSFADQQAALTLRPLTADQSTIEIQATCNNRHMTQTLHMARNAGQWQITSAQLNT